MDSDHIPDRGSDYLIVPENCYYALGDNVENSLACPRKFTALLSFGLRMHFAHHYKKIVAQNQS